MKTGGCYRSILLSLMEKLVMDLDSLYEALHITGISFLFRHSTLSEACFILTETNSRIEPNSLDDCCSSIMRVYASIAFLL